MTKYFAYVVVMTEDSKPVAEFNSTITMSGAFDCAALAKESIRQFKEISPILGPFVHSAVIKSLTVIPSEVDVVGH